MKLGVAEFLIVSWPAKRGTLQQWSQFLASSPVPVLLQMPLENKYLKHLKMVKPYGCLFPQGSFHQLSDSSVLMKNFDRWQSSGIQMFVEESLPLKNIKDLQKAPVDGVVFFEDHKKVKTWMKQLVQLDAWGLTVQIYGPHGR